MEISKRIRLSALDLPSEIWEEIISILHQDRHYDLHLQSLSRVCKFFLSFTNLHKQTLKISNPTSHFLPSLFRRFPNLKHLSLSDFTHDPNPILLQIADFDFHLESLDLSNHECLPVQALERLPVSTLIGVKSLKISSFFTIKDDDLKIIAKLFPNLEDLDLTHYSWDESIFDEWISDESGSNESSSDESSSDESSSSESSSDESSSSESSSSESSSDESSSNEDDKIVSDDGIYVLASKLKGLRRINLNGNSWVTDNSVKLLSTNCPNLEEMTVKECASVTETSIKFVLRECKNLKTFGLGAIDMWIDSVDIQEPLCQALSLSVIDFTCMDVSDAFLLAMAKANLPLKSFSLICCEGFTYDGISSFLTSYDSLDHFALVGVGIVSDENMTVLAMSLTELRSVKLNGCPKLSGSTLFTLVEQCPLLETVEMKNIKRGNKGFGAGDPVNPRIKTLVLSSNKKLSNESLNRIALACPNLETLLLKSCIRITRKGVGKTMRKCRGLKHLEIDGCIGVNSLHLGRSTNDLEFLSALGSGIDDNALIDIAEKCPNLMFLNVRGCKGLTSKGVIEVVEKCDKLKEINLRECNNMSLRMLPWVIFCRPSLRKVVSPGSLGQIDVNLFSRHGCYIC